MFVYISLESLILAVMLKYVNLLKREICEVSCRAVSKEEEACPALGTGSSLHICYERAHHAQYNCICFLLKARGIKCVCSRRK